MTILATVVALVGVVCAVALLVDGTTRGQLPDRSDAIAESAQRIVKLHRELGIDPIYDPGSYLPNTAPEEPPAPPMPAPFESGGVIAGGHPIKVYTCPRCTWALSASPQLAKESFQRHWLVEHTASDLSDEAAALRRDIERYNRECG